MCSTGRVQAPRRLPSGPQARARCADFCESPLSELRFEAKMRGHPNVMALLESFEDPSAGGRRGRRVCRFLDEKGRVS